MDWLLWMKLYSGYCLKGALAPGKFKMMMNLKQALDIAYPTRHYTTTHGIVELEERLAQHVDNFEVHSTSNTSFLTYFIQRLSNEKPSWVVHACEHVAYIIKTLAPLETVSSLVVERLNHDMKEQCKTTYQLEYQVCLHPPIHLIHGSRSTST